MAVDIPFVFDGTSAGVAGYTTAQFEQTRTSSPDLAGVPTVTQVADNEIIAFPVTGGGSAPEGATDKQVGELKKAFDAAVEPDNSRVHEEAVVLALKYPGDLTIDQIASIYSYLKTGDGSKKGWGYVRDPRGIDYFNYANASLKLGDRANCVGGGDCDDFAILMSALVESIGGTTRIILARNNTTGGHAYAEVYLGRLNVPNSQVEDIIIWLKQEFDTNKIYTHIDTDTKDVWLNLDWGADEKGNTHPGGPFFQGDKHIVLCIRDKFEKTPLKLPVKSNDPPKLISLTSDKPNMQDAGTSITWTAEAKDPDNDQIFYKFFLHDNPVTKWITDNTWVWSTTDNDIGKNQIEVQVRDTKHAEADAFDSSKVASFMIQLSADSGSGCQHDCNEDGNCEECCSTSDCPSDEVCDIGHQCVVCTDLGASCSLDSQCCSGWCKSWHCASLCSNDSDCPPETPFCYTGGCAASCVQDVQCDPSRPHCTNGQCMS